MNKEIKRLAAYDDIDVVIEGPFSEFEIIARHAEYVSLTPEQFQKKYAKHAYKPATITIDGVKYSIQYNHCDNPFCKWFGLAQKRYTSLKSKPSRYNLLGRRSSREEVSLHCNDVEDWSLPGEVVNESVQAISNWSVCEEIRRLIKINSVVPLKSVYIFHKDDCPTINLDPRDDPKGFYKRGKSTSRSQKYQCKECKKITNVLPTISERFNYNETMDGILLDFAKDIVCHAPISKTCEKLEISPTTYYHKLEVLYKRCLEFLEAHETEAFKKLNFDERIINSDAMHYNLNNIRQRGKSDKRKDILAEGKKMTFLLVSVDVESGYAIRSDIAYDFDFDLSTLEADAKLYHCGGSYSFLRKNQRLAFSHFPVVHKLMSPEDTVTNEARKRRLKNRLNYVTGCHVRQNYTAIAHFFLIKKLINSDGLHFVTDDSEPIFSSIYKVFSEDIRSKKSHHFVCQYPKNLSFEEAGERSFLTRNALNLWAKERGMEKASVMEKARKYLEDYFENNELYQYHSGTIFPSRSCGPILSPLATKSEGERIIDFRTDTNSLSSAELARIVVNVSNVTVDNFFQEIRRRINVLERPLVTARGDGKSYIYANFNPKYAQYSATIFRTFYNFCWPKNTFGIFRTPAQKIGITDKTHKIKDIVYFK